MAPASAQPVAARSPDGQRSRVYVAALAGLLVPGALVASLAAVGRAGEAADAAPLAAIALASALAAGEAALHPFDDEAPRDPADAALALASGLGLLAVTLAALLGRGALPLAARASGLALALAGLALRLAAVHALGSGFGTAAAPRATRLAQAGVYAIVRHPSESGLLALALGTALLLGSPAALALTFAVLFPASVVRARREDRALAAAFGAAHTAYRRGVGALVPSARALRGAPFNG